MNPFPHAVKEHWSWLVVGHNYVPAELRAHRRSKGPPATPWLSHRRLLIEVRGNLTEVEVTAAELIDTIEGCGDAAVRLRRGGTAIDCRVPRTWPICRCPSALAASNRSAPFRGSACAQP